MSDFTVTRITTILDTVKQSDNIDNNLMVIYSKPSQRYSKNAKIILSFELLDCEKNKESIYTEVRYNLFHISGDGGVKSLIHSNSIANLINKNMETDNKIINDVIFDYYHLEPGDKLAIQLKTPNIIVYLKTTIIENT